MEEKLNGVVEQIVFKNEDTGFAVIELAADEELVTAVGEMAAVSEGEEVELTGSFVNHPTFGPQFKVEVCEYKMPQTASAILRYLSGGVLPGIGPATARRIVEAFGEETLEVIASQPERLAGIRGLTLRKAKAISEEFRRIFGVREAMSYLAGLGIPAGSALAVYRHYGAYTIDLVKENLYLLCGYPAFMPFEQVDAIAEGQAVEREDPLRLQAGVLYVLRHNLNNGHTCLPEGRLTDTVSRFLGTAPELMEKTLAHLVEEGELFRVTFPEGDCLFLPEMYRAEETIAASLDALLHLPPLEQPVSEKELSIVQQEQGITFAPLQREAVRMAVENNCFVLTGGPGTGKTTTIRAMISLFESRGDRVALAAPTGRAAKRLAELSGREAKTIHRLLEVAYGSGAVPKFLHDEKNPLKCDVIIVDEMSMVDVTVFESLMRALKANCRVILVGDSDQLPSVGPGNILKDVLDSGRVPNVCLKEIFRQAQKSRIVVNAHHIVNGEMPKQGSGEDDFFFIESAGSACRQLVCDLVGKRLPKKYGFRGGEDIQVLCPSRVGPCGTIQMNADLQAQLNPPSPEKRQMEFMGQLFREGDKVMQVRNNYDIPYERAGGGEGIGAFNGDIGTLEKIDRKNNVFQVRFEDRIYQYSGEQLRELEIAYAVTIHKSQGSEFSAVILPVSETPPKLCYRNLLYTGVTRAKNLLVIVGSAKLVGSMVKNNKKTLRYSGLCKFLKNEEIS